MQILSKCRPSGLLSIALTMACTSAVYAAEQPIAHTNSREVQISGAVNLDRGETMLGNGSTITAGSQPVEISLNRGGQLLLCSTTSLHLSKDSASSAGEGGALMIALDRGALETKYSVGKYSDVLMTPDLRILISGPGEADLSVRINNQGDTCIDNHGTGAPYVTVTSQLEGGVYRVQPNQRVLFEHGSIKSVVDREQEPCGCPRTPVESVARAGTPSQDPAKAGQAVGGPSSTAADTAFPIAISEGLAHPAPPAKPIVPVGEAHAQVTVPFTYNGETGDSGAANIPSKKSQASTVASGASTKAEASAAVPGTAGASEPTAQSSGIAEPAPDRKVTSPGDKRPGFFGRVGHFFSHLFH